MALVAGGRAAACCFLSAPVTAAQTAWLLSTRLPVRHISFPKEVIGNPPQHDPACSLLATDTRALVHSAESLLTAENVVIPCWENPLDGRRNPLHRSEDLAGVTVLTRGA